MQRNKYTKIFHNTNEKHFKDLHKVIDVTSKMFDEFEQKRREKEKAIKSMRGDVIN